MSSTTTTSIAHYRAVKADGLLAAVDISQLEGQCYSFFELRNEAGLKTLQSWVTAPPLQHAVVAVTQVHGRPMLITRGAGDKERMLAALAQRGETLEVVKKSYSFDPWKVRSYLGFAGQSLQLTSSFLRPKRMLDSSMFVFAASNLAANVINLIYHEGQQVEDVHQLRYLKHRINRELSPHLADGERVIPIDANRSALRPSEQEHTPLAGAKSFMRHHSVAIGELGLRYLGAVGLAFPARGWKAAWHNKTLPAMDPSEYRRYAGLSSIFGKTVALSSRIPDPYNPTPPSWLDTLRERASFITGGLIEITSFGALAYACFFKSKANNYAQGLKVRGKLYPDFIGGIGASLFVLGYIVRTWAKFGERKVDMHELYAHASDMLAETPPEKIPALLANTAASLAEHFDTQKPVGFAEIYTNLLRDLQKYHAAAMSAGIGKPSVLEAGLPQPQEKTGEAIPSSRVHAVQIEDARVPAKHLAIR